MVDTLEGTPEKHANGSNPIFPHPKNLHMVGIGGCGMSPLAHLLVMQGHHVTGSDLSPSPIIDVLREDGIQVYMSHDAKHVGNPDIVVYSSAIPHTNSELQQARKMGIPIIPRSQLLSDLMMRQYGIVIAGSHGKTSTTALIFWALQALGQNPSTVFGGKFNHERSSARLGDGPFMVVESDESDGSFLKLHPTVTVLTNIDREHTEQYGSFENLILAFKTLVSRPPFYGFSVMPADCPNARAIQRDLQHRVLSFGFSEDADFRVDPQTLPWHHKNPHHLTSVTLLEREQAPIDVAFSPSGDHEVRNLLAAYATLRGLGFDRSSLTTCFEHFPGIQRRMQRVTQTSSLNVISDYAHHPVELKAALQATIHQYGHCTPLTLVFQPHRYSRFMDHADNFAEVLKRLQHVIVLPVYAASEQKPKGFEQFWDYWMQQLSQSDLQTLRYIPYPPMDTLLQTLQTTVQPRSTILFCGAGNIHHASEQMGRWADQTMDHDHATQQTL